MEDKQIKEVFKNGFYCIEPCPEIKELLAELKAKEQECEGLKTFHINLVGVKECEIKELVKYKQALTEIKEIAEKQYHTKLVDKDCINCDESFAQILQKCEVLDE